MRTPSDAAVLAWSRLIRAHDVALGGVQQALKAAGFPPLEWYDVLLELERLGPQRPKDLQGRLLLAQYNLSRLLDRMCAAGLVERRAFAGDRRGQLVAATAEGRRLRARMWPVYAFAIEAAIGARLTPAQAGELADILNRIARPGERSG
jgi:DNA-binding MarR family transcriptional regulator